MTDTPADVLEALTGFAKAVLDRRGELATADLTRATAAPRRDANDDAACERKK